MIPNPGGDLLARLVLAAILGGAIGLEREFQEKAAGLRTNILICVGSALFTELSRTVAVGDMAIGSADPTRIAAQIVSGIGFLGAGTIIQSRAHVRGLTTAATIWVVAAIGMAVGSGNYVSAVFGTLLILAVLVGLGFLERRVRDGWVQLEIETRVPGGPPAIEELLDALRDRGLDAAVSEASRDMAGGPLDVRFTARVARAGVRRAVQRLLELPEVMSVQPK